MELYLTKIEKIKALGLITKDVENIISIFLKAIDDWPDSVLSLEDYINQVKKFINSETQKENLENFLKVIDLSNNAWQAESISQILEVFNFYSENVSLDEIVFKLKKILGTNSGSY